jgi:uncharacterized YigZ family protein
MKTLSESVTASVKIQHSEFIATLYPVDDVASIKELIARHNNNYKDATHNCYAYIIGKKQETKYYSDQGEPSGTAGKPILNMLLKHEMNNVLAMVTRYYGGVKLGVRGLIDAYSEAVKLAIAKAELVDYIPTRKLSVLCDYSTLDLLKHNLHQIDAKWEVLEFADKIRGLIVFPESRQTEMESLIADLTQKQLISKILEEDI